LATGASAARAETLVALALPPGEAYRWIAGEIRAGVEEAARALAAEAGTGAPPLVIRVYEAECSAEKAARAAAAIVEARATLVVGHPCAAGAIAAAPIYTRAEIPFFAVAVRHPALTTARAAQLTFRMSGRDDRQGAEAGAWLAANSGARAALVVHDRTAGARALAETAAAEYARLTGRPASVLGIVTGGKDYPEVSRLALQTGAGALYFTGYPAEGGVMIRNLRVAGWQGGVLVQDACATDEFASLAGPAAAGTMALLATEQLAPRQAAAAAVASWSVAVASDRNGHAGSITARLRAGIETPAHGRIQFDEHGDLAGPSFRLHRLIDGRWQPAP
jgi:branched-chain amino acid transport system substrate-binding protein